MDVVVISEKSEPIFDEPEEKEEEEDVADAWDADLDSSSEEQEDDESQGLCLFFIKINSKYWGFECMPFILKSYVAVFCLEVFILVKSNEF